MFRCRKLRLARSCTCGVRFWGDFFDCRAHGRFRDLELRALGSFPQVFRKTVFGRQGPILSNIFAPWTIRLERSGVFLWRNREQVESKLDVERLCGFNSECKELQSDSVCMWLCFTVADQVTSHTAKSAACCSLYYAYTMLYYTIVYTTEVSWPDPDS